MAQGRPQLRPSGGITILADSRHVYLVLQGKGGIVEDIECFRWPVERMKLKYVKREMEEIHGGLYDLLNRLCNSTTAPNHEDS